MLNERSQAKGQEWSSSDEEPSTLKGNKGKGKGKEQSDEEHDTLYGDELFKKNRNGNPAEEKPPMLSGDTLEKKQLKNADMKRKGKSENESEEARNVDVVSQVAIDPAT